MAKYQVETDQGTYEVETEDPAQDSPDFMEAGAEKSFAEKAVGAITPEAPPQTGLGESLLQGTKEMFAPSMDSVKRLLNPNAGQFGPSRALEQAGQQVGQAVRGAAQNTAEQLATSKFGQQNTNLAAGLGTGYSVAADLASSSLAPSSFQQNLGAEGIGMAVKGLGKPFKEAAVDPARRALGFQKSQLVSQKSPFETTRKIAQANKSAKAMLEADVISPTGNLDDTIEGATKVLSGGSRKLSRVMDAVDATGKKIKPSVLDSSLIDDLKPKFDDEFRATEKILEDIKVYGKDGLSLKDLDELRARWGKIGFQDKTVNSTEANMYREAFKSIDKQAKKHIESVSPDLLADYTSGKSAQENAINALRGLNNKKAADLGNDLVSLPSKVLAAGQLAAGDIPGAAATAGISQAVKRRGMAVLATGMQGAGRALEKGAPTGFMAIIQAAARNALAGPPPKKSEEPNKSKSKYLDILTPDVKGRAEALEVIPKALPTMTKDQQAFAKGLQALLRNDLQGARGLWQKALKLNRKNLEARRGLERLAMRDKQDDIDIYKPK